jgi:hypothetical protein
MRIHFKHVVVAALVLLGIFMFQGKEDEPPHPKSRNLVSVFLPLICNAQLIS